MEWALNKKGNLVNLCPNNISKKVPKYFPERDYHFSNNGTFLVHSAVRTMECSEFPSFFHLLRTLVNFFIGTFSDLIINSNSMKFCNFPGFS